MPVQIVTQPALEPVSLDEAKVHLRVIDSADDDLIANLISTARIHAETICRRALISQQWKMAADRFPSPMAGKLNEYWLGQQWGLAGMGGVSQFFPSDRSGYGILLPFSPLISVDSIKYIDTTGTQQTLALAAYSVDTYSEPARIMNAYGYAWPSTRQQINAVEVTFTCGYGTAPSSVPAGIRHWILMMTATMYENREAVAILGKGKVEILPFVEGLLDPYRVQTF
jgi:Phage gp6-like head-tail connector protein